MTRFLKLLVTLGLSTVQFSRTLPPSRDTYTILSTFYSTVNQVSFGKTRLGKEAGLKIEGPDSDCVLKGTVSYISISIIGLSTPFLHELRFRLPRVTYSTALKLQRKAYPTNKLRKIAIKIAGTKFMIFRLVIFSIFKAIPTMSREPTQVTSLTTAVVI